jgi:ABC-2 type transport system ATP-binding protein
MGAGTVVALSTVLAAARPTLFGAALMAVSSAVAYLAGPYVHEAGHALAGRLLGARAFEFRPFRSRFQVGHAMSMTRLPHDRAAVTAVLVAGAGSTALAAAIALLACPLSWPPLVGIGLGFAAATVREFSLLEAADFARLLSLWTSAVERRLRKGVPIARLHADGVTRGKTCILQRNELEIETGWIVGILGPNGSGKTTVLELLAGLMPESTRGRTIATNARVAYAPADDRFLPNALVGEALNYSAAMMSAQRDRTTEAALNLAHLLTHRLRHASNGEAQKLSLALALQQRADLLLLDEPELGLDPAARATLHRLLRERAERGCAIVLSSHLVADALDLCTHLALMADGRIVRFGPSESFTDLRAQTHRIRAWIPPVETPRFIAQGFTVAQVSETAVEIVKVGTPNELFLSAQQMGTSFLQFTLESNSVGRVTA